MAMSGKLLQVNIKLMQFLNMWPKGNKIESKRTRLLRDLLGSVNVFIGLLSVLSDFIIQIRGQNDDIMDITENLTALGALFGPIYMGICFIQNRKRIMELIHDLNIFEEFDSVENMLKTDRKTSFITKIFVSYGVIGNLIYAGVPYMNIEECNEKRSRYKYYKEMPCELITRFRVPFKYENNWYAVQAAALWQLFACLNATVIMLSVTMFVVALLMQVIAQLQELRKFIRKNNSVRDSIRYHIAVIGYASNMSQAFSSTMLVYLTLASFQISVLGFEVLMAIKFTDSIRYALHLGGWVLLLYLVCSYGQQLIDESKGIGWEAYSIPWYELSVSEQKDLKLMIMRSQKPLILTAASLGSLSLESFLNVLSTAYSYFTLLLHMRKNS